MEKYGKIFRILRKDRGLTQKQAAFGVMSNKTLSEFELGKHEIKLQDFLGIINNLHISLEEFEYLLNEYELNNFRKTLANAINFYDAQKIKPLKRLINHEFPKHKIAKLSTFDYLNYLMLKSMANAIDNEEVSFSTQEKNKIINYLKSIKNWNYYELTLYANTMRVLDDNAVVALSNAVVTNTTYYEKIPKNKYLIVDILLNTVIAFINRKQINQANHFKQLLEKNLDAQSFYTKTILLFLEGVIDFYNGNEVIGKRKMEKGLDILENLDGDRLTDTYQNIFDVVTKKQKKS